MTDTAPPPTADPATIRNFLANHSVRIFTGWAPKGLEHKHPASKLVEIVFLHTLTSAWLWRENAAPEWQVVSEDHWAAQEALAAKGWAQLEVEPRTEQGIGLLALISADYFR